MTIYESLAYWLDDIFTDPSNSFSGEFVIDVEVLPSWIEYENAALYSNPNDMAYKMMGGQVRHTDYKTLYIQRAFKEQEQRMANEAFFEHLKWCIFKKNLSAIFPDDGRKWRSIEYTGGVYPSSKAENNDTAIYQITLKIIYEEMG